MKKINKNEFIKLTMELDLKTREFKVLKEKLEDVKKNKANYTNNQILELKKIFEQNQEEIIEISKKIEIMKNNIEKQENNKKEKYNKENIFQKEEKKLTNNDKISVIDEKNKINENEKNKNLLEKIIHKIMNIFKK